MGKTDVAHTLHGETNVPQQRLRFVHEYDRLISQFGEDPFRPSAVCQRSDALTKVVDQIGSATLMEKHDLLKELTEKSLRCAELIEKTLEAADKFKHIDEKIAEAQRCFQAGGVRDEEDEDEDMGGSGDEDEESALLLRDLITVSEEMQQANKSLSQMGVVAKSTRASRALLSSTDQLLQASLVGLGATGQTAAISEEFRELYSEEFTAAFGDELDQFRQEDRFESKDVTYLISCIHSGADIFTPLQKKMFVESTQSTSRK